MEGINYNGCKVVVFNSQWVHSVEPYAEAINDFLANHNIVNVIPAQSDTRHSVHIFYRDSEVKNG